MDKLKTSFPFSVQIHRWSGANALSSMAIINTILLSILMYSEWYRRPVTIEIMKQKLKWLCDFSEMKIKMGIWFSSESISDCSAQYPTDTILGTILHFFQGDIR